MEEQVIYIIGGAMLGYFGFFLQHKLELNRKYKSEIRQEKIKIYSNVLSELNGGCIDIDKIRNLNKKKNHLDIMEFRFRLGRIIGPAKLIAPMQLNLCLDELMNLELQLYELLVSSDLEADSDDKTTNFIERVMTKRKQVEIRMHSDVALK
jgi:hypothetical protein